MVTNGGPGRKARLAYKVTVELFPHEWDKLRMEAQTRGITGGELIASIVSWYVEVMSKTPTIDGDEGHAEDA